MNAIEFINFLAKLISLDKFCESQQQLFLKNFRLGMMRTAEGGLHYYINGEDQGLAIDGVPSGVYAVIDLYGVCGQV